MDGLTLLRTEMQSARWNALIPARACRFEFYLTHVRYLHPTKGWRRVDNRRLGI